MNVLQDWIESVLEVADTEGMTDDQVIDTWPADVASKYPALTVGAVREWQAARAQIKGRFYTASSGPITSIHDETGKSISPERIVELLNSRAQGGEAVAYFNPADIYWIEKGGKA